MRRETAYLRFCAIIVPSKLLLEIPQSARGYARQAAFTVIPSPLAAGLFQNFVIFLHAVANVNNDIFGVLLKS